MQYFYKLVGLLVRARNRIQVLGLKNREASDRQTGIGLLPSEMSQGIGLLPSKMSLKDSSGAGWACLVCVCAVPRDACLVCAVPRDACMPFS